MAAWFRRLLYVVLLAGAVRLSQRIWDQLNAPAEQFRPPRPWPPVPTHGAGAAPGSEPAPASAEHPTDSDSARTDDGGSQGRRFTGSADQPNGTPRALSPLSILTDALAAAADPAGTPSCVGAPAHPPARDAQLQSAIESARARRAVALAMAPASGTHLTSSAIIRASLTQTPSAPTTPPAASPPRTAPAEPVVTVSIEAADRAAPPGSVLLATPRHARDGAPRHARRSTEVAPATGRTATDRAGSAAPRHAKQSTMRRRRDAKGQSGWVQLPLDLGGADPEHGGVCPVGYLVKANSRSHIYHLPGMAAYDRTVPDRCYQSAEDAERAGFRAAKR